MRLRRRKACFQISVLSIFRERKVWYTYLLGRRMSSATEGGKGQRLLFSRPGRYPPRTRTAPFRLSPSPEGKPHRTDGILTRSKTGGVFNADILQKGAEPLYYSSATAYTPHASVCRRAFLPCQHSPNCTQPAPMSQTPCTCQDTLH